ncbi:hypothetical protein L484_027647 [Morus notabilis]|uniref:RNase H type-1 domain-containing protein n=1 Tax=Morus notabilis TaxID=981085 RepID=W9RCD8_9ROSA|nr:hypothetical protein L484_027647 [Morus notabilis]
MSVRMVSSVFPHSDSVGVGGLIRDSSGFVLGAFAKKLPGAFSVLTAECLAVREGLIFCSRKWSQSDIC